MKKFSCKKYNSSSNHVKSGHVRGLQRYKCKKCGYQFTNTKPREVPPSLKSFATVPYAH